MCVGCTACGPANQVNWTEWRWRRGKAGCGTEPNNTALLLLLLLLLFFNLLTPAFKAYCAIWVRRSNFRHQASPRVSPRDSTQRRKVELWARNVRKFCLNVDFHVTFMDLLHAVMLRHGTDGFISPPKEGVLRIFSPGANSRTCVPKATEAASTALL
jgi:hypothetical protein